MKVFWIENAIRKASRRKGECGTFRNAKKIVSYKTRKGDKIEEIEDGSVEIEFDRATLSYGYSKIAWKSPGDAIDAEILELEEQISDLETEIRQFQGEIEEVRALVFDKGKRTYLAKPVCPACVGTGMIHKNCILR